MTSALLFAGQGDRTLPQALRNGLKEKPHLLLRALDASDCSPEEALKMRSRLLECTRLQQPLQVALSLIASKQLVQRGIEVDYVAGHSLGELTAWGYAGVVSHEQAVDLAARRGQSMSKAAQQHDGGMLALTNTSTSELDHILKLGNAHGVVSPAAYNTEKEIVLSGSHLALKALLPLFPSRRLHVEGPWHSPLMNEAASEMKDVLSDLPMTEPRIPILSGLDGSILTSTEQIRDSMITQLTHPVRWTDVLGTLTSAGVDHYFIAGPGRALAHVIRNNLPSVRVEVI